MISLHKKNVIYRLYIYKLVSEVKNIFKKSYSLNWTRFLLHRFSIVIIVVWTLLPIFWVIMTSLKQPIDIISPIPKIIFKPTLRNYMGLFERYDFARYFFNSVIIGFFSTTISLVLGLFAAYSLSRFKVIGGNILMTIALLVRMVPGIVIIFPLVQMFVYTHLYGTKWALILAHSTFLLPLTIWMMKGFFDEVPLEIEESAMIDGCNRLGILFRITIPLSIPGIIACFILNLIMSWNEFMFAMILTSGDNRTLPVLVAGFIEFVSIDYGKLTAASTLVMIPMLLFGIFIQRYLVKGLTGGIH
jgi:multiple sugar transport system permease protein